MANLGNESTFSVQSFCTKVSCGVSVIEKLRRLKIQERLYSKSINRTAEPNPLDVSLNENYSNSKNVFAKVKKTYVEIKHLFDEIKTNINQDNDLDMDDVKKDVFDLEAKIKTFKLFLQSQIASLKVTEKILLKQLNEDSAEVDRVKRCTKIKSKAYNDIVPSPVRVLINAPFKSPEVQQLQEFMMNSKSFCGGWIPYNHNIFIKTWKKYFGAGIYSDGGNADDIEKNDNFQLFIKELLQKLPDITTEEIITHSKWYSKCSKLKDRQQTALNKWKTNRDLIKKVHRTRMNPKPLDQYFVNKASKKRICDRSDIHAIYFANTSIEDEISENSCDKTELMAVRNLKLKNTSQELQVTEHGKQRFLKPTAQWNNRCNTINERLHSNNITGNLNTVHKHRLRTPEWRLVLKQD